MSRNFTKKEIKEIHKHIVKIDKMELKELLEYDRKLYDSKPLMDDDIFKEIKGGMDIQMAYLMEISSISPMAIMSELGEGDKGDLI